MRDEVRARVCGEKVRMGRGAAMALGARLRADGEQMSAYRCWFCAEWHVGHPPRMDTLEELAAVIRERRCPE